VPPRIVSSAGHREEGTASIALIAVIPFLLLAVLVAAQIALAGQALWSAGVAARAGARAALVGGDVVEVARQALPDALRPESKIGDSDEVAVQVVIPQLLPGLPPLKVAAKTGLGDG
jgi:hypothetical protein